MDNLHSRLVSWVKIILPLIALGLLSTLFLFARQTTPQSDLSFAEIREIAEEQRMTAPHFSGLTDDGATFDIVAQFARPDIDQLGLVNLDQVVMRMENAGGNRIDATASVGAVNSNTQTAELSGLVYVETSDNYQMETNRLIAQVESGTITSEGLLEVRAPFGRLTAGQVTFYDNRNDAGQQMVFTDGVQLIYRSQDDARQE